MKKNILFLSLLIIFITIYIAISNIYNIKNEGVKSTINNAKTISQIIKSGLNTHAFDDDMKKVTIFMESISHLENIEKLWFVRSEKIDKQYNNSNFKTPRDDLDKKVLQTGIMQFEIKDNFNTSKVRVSFPYKAIQEKGVDCLSCHNVNKNETLGVISLELEVDILMNIIRDSVYYLVLILIVTMFLFYIISKRILTPHKFLINVFKGNLNEALEGNFKKIEAPSGQTDEISEVTKNYNKLMSIFKNTTEEIDNKLQTFIGSNISSNKKTNPLEESKDIINKLSDLYQFKKEVEHDNTKEEIYERLSQVMINKFNLKNFTFAEIDNENNKITKILEEGESFYCNKTLCESPNLCRSARTKSDVYSIDLHNSCQYFESTDKFYYCFNVNIVDSLFLIIHCVVETKEEFEELKQKAVFIKNYLREATPSLEVNQLMIALKESAFRDGLTGLYNRKFLEEHSCKLIPQAKRENINIGVLMLDMDHFKAVNDEYGHDIGDKVLKELAIILEEQVRESDLVIRYGGEEFIVLLVGVKDENCALDIANTLGRKVRENEIDVYAGTKLKKTISIGLSMFPDDAKTLDSALKNADIALYEAKSSGRDKVVRFKEEQISSVDLF